MGIIYGGIDKRKEDPFFNVPLEYKLSENAQVFYPG